MQRYEKYKDSGIEWLGKIPEHWEVRKIKYLFNEINERTLDGSGDLLSVSQYSGVQKKADKLNEGDLLTNASTLEGYKVVRKKQLVSNIMLAWNGSLAFSDYDGITSPAYCVYELQANNYYKYFHYLLKTDVYKSEFKRKSSGVIESRLRLYTENFFSISSILPPIHEQYSIANFLDNKCEKIDAAVNLKEQQIEKLKELRQITIHNAVTKGISQFTGETANMKDSGIDWIGEIPEHWKVATFKMVSTFILDGTHGSYPRTESGFRLLSVRNIVKDEFILRDDDSFISKVHFEEITKKFLNKEGDILLTIVGGTLGKASIIKVISEKFATQRSLATIRIREIYNNLFYYYYIISPGYHSFLWSNTNYSAQPGIYLNTISNSNVVIPPFLEQIQIVSYLENQTSKIDKAIAQKQEQIIKLKEYKQSLINEVVTGKIKVTL